MAPSLAGRRRLDKALRREIESRVEKARESLSADGKALKSRIHEARRDLKKARAALRLARPRLKTRLYRAENAALRDAGRAMSAARDAQVLPAVLDGLLTGADKRRFAEARRSLAHAARAASPDGHVRRAAAPALAAADRVARGLRPSARRWRAVSKGLRETYAAGRASLAAARKHGSAEDFHEWRKAAKYLRYQLDLLRAKNDGPLARYIAGLHQLTDLLGDDHDLGTLRARAEAHSEDFGGDAKVARLLRLIDRRRASLRAKALPLGETLYALRPKDAVKAWRARWRSSLA